MKSKFIQADLSAEYYENYPSFPALTLARLMHKEHPEVYKSIEAARSSLRHVQGKNGESNRNSAKKRQPGFIKETRTTHTAEYQLPKTWAHPKTVFKLPTECNNVGFISDAQVPFQDNQAIEACYEWLKGKKVNTIFINGDWIDFYGMSHFEKDPRRRRFQEEYRNILISLEHMRHHFPTEKIYYNLDANHELRYDKYMTFRTKELLELELPEYNVKKLLRLDLFDINGLKNNDHYMIGKLPIVHGHTIFQGTTSPVSTGRTVYMKTKQSAIASHCHQTSEYTTKKLDGEIITCWTNGCLMDLNVEYNPHGNNYNHGFTHITTESNGDYHVDNKRIYKGKVL